MYMASKCYYMDLLGMSGNINIQSKNKGTTESDIRTEVILSDWPQWSSGTWHLYREAKTIMTFDPLRGAYVYSHHNNPLYIYFMTVDQVSEFFMWFKKGVQSLY